MALDLPLPDRDDTGVQDGYLGYYRGSCVQLALLN
jgi:hypothetical protein